MIESGSPSSCMRASDRDSDLHQIRDYHRHSVGDTSDIPPLYMIKRVECQGGRCICTDIHSVITQQSSTQARLALREYKAVGGREDPQLSAMER